MECCILGFHLDYQLPGTCISSGFFNHTTTTAAASATSIATEDNDCSTNNNFIKWDIRKIGISLKPDFHFNNRLGSKKPIFLCFGNIDGTHSQQLPTGLCNCRLLASSYLGNGLFMRCVYFENLTLFYLFRLNKAPNHYHFCLKFLICS